jgi:hypothetical protein
MPIRRRSSTSADEPGTAPGSGTPARDTHSRPRLLGRAWHFAPDHAHQPLAV